MTIRSLLCYGSIQVKQICIYVFGINRFTKNNTKLDQGEDRLAQTLVFPKFSFVNRNTWCLNLLRRNIMMKSSFSHLPGMQGLWIISFFFFLHEVSNHKERKVTYPKFSKQV